MLYIYGEDVTVCGFIPKSLQPATACKTQAECGLGTIWPVSKLAAAAVQRQETEQGAPPINEVDTLHDKKSKETFLSERDHDSRRLLISFYVVILLIW